jgi:hypothetical protein
LKKVLSASVKARNALTSGLSITLRGWACRRRASLGGSMISSKVRVNIAAENTHRAQGVDADARLAPCFE